MTDRCSTRCDHDSQCTLSAGHGDRHETDHGCICYDQRKPTSPNDTAWSLSAVWMADMAEALEHVRHEDGAPKRLTPDVLLELVVALREDRDYYEGLADRLNQQIGGMK